MRVHCPAFSFQKGLIASELNVHSSETFRELMVHRKPRRYQPLVAFLRSGLRHQVMIGANADEWRRTRDAIDPELQAANVAARYAPIIQQVAADAFSRLAGDTAATSGSEVFIEPLMRTVTLSILGHMLFGNVLPFDEASQMEGILTTSTEAAKGGIVEWVNRLFGAIFGALRAGEYQPVLFSPRRREAADRVLAWISERIDRTKRAGLRTPLLERLEQRYADRPRSRRKRAIVAEYAMMCIAGIETTAAALTLAIAEIANDDTLRASVVKEAREQGCPAGGAQGVVARFPLLHCVFRETLRRHTIVPTFLRETEKDYTLVTDHPDSGTNQPIRVSRGTTLRYLPFLGHLRRTVWADPHRFDPCRFAGPLSSEQAENYMPFGFGPQRCPGHAMATTETILILAEFFRRFDIEPGKTAKKGIALKRNVIFTNRPVGVTARVRPVQAGAGKGGTS
jgi:cytochrome P450